MPDLKLNTPVQYLKGVGPKVAKLFKKLGVETIEDLFYFIPRDYEDRSQIKPIAKLSPSDSEIIKGEVAGIDHQLTRNRFSILKVTITDRSGAIVAVWFNQPYLERVFRKGMKLILSGKVEYSSYEGALQFSVKDYEVDTGENPKIVPIYPLTEGLYPKHVRKVIQIALENCLDLFKEYLPDQIKAKYHLSDLKEALLSVHYPNKLEQVAPARQRLAFDELFVFQIGMGLRKNKLKKEPGIAFGIKQNKLEEFIRDLPFSLTGSQNKVLEEILNDMQNPQPMNRLLQGDVGSGKTIIATIAAYVAITNGYQAALMAPTEILAQQHYLKLNKFTEKLGLKIVLLTSTTSKKVAQRELEEADLMIGTHALLEKKVKFRRLGLVIIDEQHRFGVLQRANLVQKGVTPDVLVMTATPIPRSLALTVYGDLDRSIINELPPGRTPIKTHFVPAAKRRSAYEFMREKIKEGRQVFIVCPLVEESEELDLKAAKEEADYLQKEVFPELKVGLMHGRMTGEEKDRIMGKFRDKKIAILVSTTVIEVGIDIPNATVMIIEHAERFGLAQLHQLRGRIGRGSEQSYCFLMADPKSPEAKARIKAMLETNDGFEIAEVDLRLRGPGEFYGTRQSGLPNFRVADIIRDDKLLQEARVAALDLIATDQESARNIWQSQREKIKGTFSGATLN